MSRLGVGMLILAGLLITGCDANRGSSEKTINVDSTAMVKINSELKTGSNTVMAGAFSGNAIATISYN